MSLLDVRDLTIRYGDSAVVDALSFGISRGESVGLVGETGAGKSQTALAIPGLLPRQARVGGSILFDGLEILGKDENALNEFRARRIGMVFQDPAQALNPYLRIGRQLRQVLVHHDLAQGRDADARVIEMLAQVGLPDPGRQFRAYPHQLSGGMRQRVMLAAALLAEPDLLIADEPTTALDVTVQAQILDLLDDVRENTALLLITHDLGVVAGRCERMLVLEKGRLVESGSTTALFAAPRHAHTKALLVAAARIDRGPVPAPVASGALLIIGAASVSHGALCAVREVSFALQRGETVAVVGESGSGKTSLIRALLGLEPLSSGQVVYAGKPLASPVERRPLAIRRDLQLVFQDPAGSLDPQMRIAEIVAEPLLVHEPQLAGEERRAQVVKILERVGLGEKFLRRFPHELSGGQAQRVAIARALVTGPRILVCDEAFAALDASVRAQVLDVLRDAQRDTGLAIIFISHDLAVVRSVAHRVLVMYLGQLVEVAGTERLFAAPQHPYTQALLDSVPVPDPIIPPRRAPLRGEVPSPLDPPAGCVFHPRCGIAAAACSERAPVLRDIDGTRVACHLAERR